jgi:histidyl-tRNA synthetase
MIQPKTLKGFRDFLPQQARKRDYALNILKKVFESYGFEPLETPALEYEEILTGKYGDEGEKLMYRFEDNGGRRVAMRYDQTVPLARVVSQYQNALPLPFKRYQIQPVWRAENTQKGRYREFLQCDIDIVGTDSLNADAEAIAVTAASFDRLGFKNYKIQLNDRSVFGDLPITAVISIDKLKKIGEEGVRKDLQEKGIDPEVLTKIMNTPLPDSLKYVIDQAVKMGATKDKLIFNPTIARGLNYYTGTIFETELEDYLGGSVCSGGRYDDLIGMFTATTNLPAGRKVPAVGTSFGLDRIIDAMDEKDMFGENTSSAKVLVTVFAPEFSDKSLEVALLLRSKNIATELFLDENVKIEKQLKYADQKNIPYVILLGPKELEKNIVTVKNLKTREQNELKLEQLAEEINQA